MDLVTFVTALYVYVDDWYKANWEAKLRRRVGARPRMSDSEVLTVMIVGQWRAGVSWDSERGLLRWLSSHEPGLFPRLLKRSAFNERGRKLWSVFIDLQQAVADELGVGQAVCECVDGLPLPAYSCGQALRENGHWLWESKEGHGGTNGGWFFGNRLLASVTEQGVLTGWLLATANVSERFILQALLSARAGCPTLDAPGPDAHHKQTDYLLPPVERIGPFQAVGAYTSRPYLADGGFNTQRWADHWYTTAHAHVLAPPSRHTRAGWSAAFRHLHARTRQVIETVFAVLSDVFDLKHVNAHSYHGLYTRVAAKAAAFNLGILFNRRYGRPDFAHATLIL
jgi:hypothetical protein